MEMILVILNVSLRHLPTCIVWCSSCASVRGFQIDAGRWAALPDSPVIIEIVGYRGTHCHVQLALYFVMEAAALEKLVINPVQRLGDWLVRDVKELEEEGRTIHHANLHLRRKVPSTVEHLNLHLEVKLDFHCEDDIPNFKRFIEASPYLHRLVLKLHKCKRTRPGDKCRKMGRISRFPRDYLKVVEIVGYRGTHCHDQLSLYFVMEAAALEKLVIDPVRRWRDWLDRYLGELPLPYHVPSRRWVDWLDRDFSEVQEEGQAIQHAKRHLGRIVPSTVEFVCLQS
ncbi:hypothetical protein ACLB2K_058381 [Fragaria x ananassa]